MFSFRTTSIEEQLDRSLTDGQVGCFCTQNCWNASRREYLTDIFRKRGNLAKVLTVQSAEISPETNHIEFSQEDLDGLDALVIEIQDVGVRYFNYTRDVMRLLSFRARMETGPSIYVIDHINPAGRIVEGGIPVIESDIWTPQVANRHGLTLGELCNLYCNEIDARFPLHIISAFAGGAAGTLLPWAIAPASDIPGMFTCLMYSGGGLWNNTNITPGIGTTRPYEYIGAPFIKANDVEHIPTPDGVLMRPCSFTPSAGRYTGQKCNGYQILLTGDTRYHSLLHTLQLMRYFSEHYSEFTMDSGLHTKIANPVISEYLNGSIPFDIVEEHIKLEEQKWIRKARRFTLYDDSPYRIK